MSGFVTTLGDKAQRFEAELTNVRAQFRATMSAIAALRDVADDLAAAAEAGPGDATDAGRHLAPLLWPLCTMAREREIHTALLGTDAQEASTVPGEDTAPSIDDLLFAEAS